MSEPVNPFALDEGDLMAWCAREQVSYPGLEALRRVGQLGTRYHWDAARRGTVVTRAGALGFFLPHDWLERAIEERDARRAAQSAATVAEVATVQPVPVASPSAAPAPRPAQRPADAPVVRPRVEQLGLFGGGR